MPTKIKDLKSDIDKFNDYIDGIILDLAAGGETSSNLIVYLFKLYLIIKDKVFNQFIVNKKEKFGEGDPSITLQVLMDMALNKYNMLKQSKTWKVKTPEEEKLIALTAQLKEAKEKITELAKKTTSTSRQREDPKKQSPKLDTEGPDPKKKKGNLNPGIQNRKGLRLRWKGMARLTIGVIIMATGVSMRPRTVMPRRRLTPRKRAL